MTEDPWLFDVAPAGSGVPVEVDEKPVKRTESDMIELLRERYGTMYGNGIRYASAAHVRSHAGFDARRTADFIAMDLWPSKGLALHGHEVKVSRSDWLTELPEGWGLMAPRGNRLAVIVPAVRQKNPYPLSRSRLAAFVRAIAKGAS